MWRVLKGPACEVLTVINVPPPHFGEGSFITVHQSTLDFFARIKKLLVLPVCFPQIDPGLIFTKLPKGLFHIISQRWKNYIRNEQFCRQI